jgi:enamine deaminase RidA (YjgF/YER057c/UK114 family)
MTIQIVKTDKAPEAVGTYSQGAIYNGVFLFFRANWSRPRNYEA